MGFLISKRNKARRNQDGLTMREQQKAARIQQIMRLKVMGLNQSEIARKLDITRQAVSKLLK